MNKGELVKTLADELEIPTSESKRFLEAFQSVVTKAVKKGDPVTVTGFAKFARIDRPARMGRNPATGEQIKIKAKRVVRITPLKAFKDSVMGGKK